MMGKMTSGSIISTYSDSLTLVMSSSVKPPTKSASANVAISVASANCGMSLGGTKEQTSISGRPDAASAAIHAFLASVGMNIRVFCRPSRGETS